MGKRLKLADVAANAGIAAVVALLDGGLLRIYSGIQPSSANTALSAQAVLLATLTFGFPAFVAPTAGVASANPIGADPSMSGTGIASFARLVKADGTSVVLDISVGVSGCDLNFDSVNFQAGQPCSITSWSLTLPE